MVPRRTEVEGLRFAQVDTCLPVVLGAVPVFGKFTDLNKLLKFAKGHGYWANGGADGRQQATENSHY
jgi:hypothetical protein